MREVSEHFERLIVRRLDGEISAEERLELDRELLRNPAARELLDAYAAIDELAAVVLRESAERSAPRLVVPAAAAVSPAAHRGRWVMWSSALAACLALIVYLSTPEGRPVAPVGSGSGIHNIAPAQPVIQPGSAGVWRASDLPTPHIDRTTDRNLLMVTDPAGNVYLLNLDRVREVQRADDAPWEYANNPV